VHEQICFPKSVFFLAVAPLTVAPASAFDWDYKGSLGEGKHGHYVPPVSNPFLNETPFITTEVRLLYIYNNFPNNILTSGLGPLGGGNLVFLGTQFRVAVSDRLGLIVNKFGYADFNLKVPNRSDDGLINISLGLKYVLWSDTDQDALVTLGATYEIPSGTLKSGSVNVLRLQGDGNGFITPFVTAVKRYYKFSVQAMLSSKITLDQDRNASWFNYALHMDYEILPDFFPLVEFNGFTPINDPRQNQLKFEGIDLFSIGGADPQPVVTFASGARYKFDNNVMAGLVYEVPLTNDKDIIDWRVTADLVIYY